MTQQKCLHCHEPFYGRSDKKFCCDQCRSTYNNQRNTQNNAMSRRIISILRRNRRILKNLNPKGRAKVHRLQLIEEGFNFYYLTNIYHTQKGKTYYFCFDQGYLQLDNEYYYIIDRKDYV